MEVIINHIELDIVKNILQRLQEICSTQNNSSLNIKNTSLDDEIRSCKMKNFEISNPTDKFMVELKTIMERYGTTSEMSAQAEKQLVKKLIDYLPGGGYKYAQPF